VLRCRWSNKHHDFHAAWHATGKVQGAKLPVAHLRRVPGGSANYSNVTVLDDMRALPVSAPLDIGKHQAIAFDRSRGCGWHPRLPATLWQLQSSCRHSTCLPSSCMHGGRQKLVHCVNTCMHGRTSRTKVSPLQSRQCSGCVLCEPMHTCVLHTVHPECSLQNVLVSASCMHCP
jgi:hypothetical protein